MDAGGCSARAFDCFLGALAARECNAHAAVFQGAGLGEDAKIDRISRRSQSKRVGDPFEGEVSAFAVREDDGRRRRADQLYRTFLLLCPQRPPKAMCQAVKSSLD